MKRSYLVQRLEKPTDFINPFNFGGGYKNGGLSDDAMKLLQPIFSFAYMGAAEYEFGAVPKSFQEMIKNVEDYERIEVCPKGYGAFHVFCHKDHIPHMEQKIRDILIGNETRDRVYHADFGWLELDNHWIMFRDSKAMDKWCDMFTPSDEDRENND